MFSRIRIALGLTLLLSLVFAVPVFAGGWAVITLDELPTHVVAGESLTIGFTVLQHGKTPLSDLAPTITVMLPKSEYFVVNAEPQGKPGHYTATLIFPKEGDWEWSIQAFTMDQPMPALSVTAPVVGTVDQPITSTEPIPEPISPLLVVRVAAFGIGLAGLIFAFQRKSRLVMAVTAVCLLVGVASFVAAPSVPAVEAQSKSSSGETENKTTMSDVEVGRRLFVAKGCITCHVNNKVENASAYWTIEMGAPDLTDLTASPEVLRIRLKDPAAAKSDTQMPNLGLKNDEIEALIAFINSD